MKLEELDGLDASVRGLRSLEPVTLQAIDVQALIALARERLQIEALAAKTETPEQWTTRMAVACAAPRAWPREVIVAHCRQCDEASAAALLRERERGDGLRKAMRVALGTLQSPMHGFAQACLDETGTRRHTHEHYRAIREVMHLLQEAHDAALAGKGIPDGR